MLKRISEKDRFGSKTAKFGSADTQKAQDEEKQFYSKLTVSILVLTATCEEHFCFKCETTAHVNTVTLFQHIYLMLCFHPEHRE